MLTLLLNGHIYAPDDLGIGHLLIAGETIVWIGTEEPSISGISVRRVDLEGRRLVPGLIDPHVHLTGGGGEAGPATRVAPIDITELTNAGITTAIGLLGTDDLTRTPQGLLATTRGLVDQGLSAWCLTGGYHLPPTTITGSVRSDIVHIDRMIGVGEVALSDHRSSQPTFDELVKVAAEAHVAGLMTNKAGVLHLHMGDGVRGLELVRQALATAEIPARVFNPTHVNRRCALFDEALELAGLGCVIDVTAFPPTDDPEEINAYDAVLRYLESDLPAANLTVSSDGGGCLPCFDDSGRVASFDVGSPKTLTEVLTQLLEDGVAPERALPAFSTNAASLLRLPGKGRIAVGADADLVVLDEVSVPQDVMARGRWFAGAEARSSRLLSSN